jgi:YfiH family protein
MKLRRPFYPLAGHFAIDLPGARAVFTTRRGGHSSGPYASLNLGFLTDDDQGLVTRNRATVQAELGVSRLSFVHQIHGAQVRRITAGSPEPAQLPRVDGQATDVRGVAAAALVADCLPIAVAGDGAVAMLHAGWRGLAGGVVAAGVEAVRGLGAVGALSAAIGPGAGRCCYEVGPEVHAAFERLPGAVHCGDKLDLKAIARHELGRAGVAVIDDIDLCTICSERALLFSHRRDHGVTGRQAGVAWLT